MRIHPPWQFTTYAYISAAPNPVGVGQNALIYVGSTTRFKAIASTTISDSETTN